MARKKSKKQKSVLKEILKVTFSFWGIIIIILSVRWLLVEPYVIPSGSMIPSLLVYDHIVVNKFAYGIRAPFSSLSLWQRKTPQRGDVVVFRAKHKKIFMIKRVIGLPGEEVFLDKKGQIWIDNQKLIRKGLLKPEEDEDFYRVSEANLKGSYKDYRFFVESTKAHDYRVMYKKTPFYRWEAKVYKVPSNHVLVLGDNRDDSSDSRVWGTLPMNKIMGRAFGVWLSCNETLSFLPFLCSPLKIRWKRLFRKIH